MPRLHLSGSLCGFLCIPPEAPLPAGPPARPRQSDRGTVLSRTPTRPGGKDGRVTLSGIPAEHHPATAPRPEPLHSLAGHRGARRAAEAHVTGPASRTRLPPPGAVPRETRPEGKRERGRREGRAWPLPPPSRERRRGPFPQHAKSARLWPPAPNTPKETTRTSHGVLRTVTPATILMTN